MTEPASHLDLTFLHAQTFGDTALEREVLQLFLDQGRRLLPSLIDGPVAQQMATAHLLKGSCQGIGAGPLADLLERYGRAERAERRGMDEDLRHGFAQVAAAIEARLAAL